jgi:hypothetical protein
MGSLVQVNGPTILLKFTNGVHNWGFVIRLTDAQGHPLKSLKFSPSSG